MACTENNLLSKIEIQTGIETSLVGYVTIESIIPKSICTISTKDNFVYIGISHIITNNVGNDNQYLEYKVLKIQLTNDENDGPILDDSTDIKTYNLEYKEKNFNDILLRPFSCEVINIEDDVNSDRLVCGYIRLNDTSDKLSYILNVTVINSDFDNIENEKTVDIFSRMPYIRLQRIDPTTIIYFITDYSYNISLKNEDIFISNISDQFHYFSSVNGLFFYNNEHLFCSTHHSMYIKKRNSGHYLQVMDENINDNSIKFQKLIGYHKKEGDKFLLIYEYTSNNIKYVTFENMTPLYSFKVNEVIIERISNTPTEYNVSQLIVDPEEHKLLSIHSLTYYISTTNHTNKYDKYNFDRDTQMLTVNGSLSDWVSFNFFFCWRDK